LNPGQFHFVFLLLLFHLENHVCLSRDLQVAGAAWRAATRTMAGVGDLVQRIEDGSTGQVLGGRAVRWRRVRSAPGTWRLGAWISWLSLKIKVDGFSSVWASKLMTTVCEWFGLKTTPTVFAGLASKPVVMVSHRSGPQNRWRQFVSGLASKPLGWFSPIWPQNRW
jgi:hypothetical protein